MASTVITREGLEPQDFNIVAETPIPVEQGTTDENEIEWSHGATTSTTRCAFAFLFLLFESLLHLSVYVFKLTEDTLSVREYWEKRQMWGLSLTIVSLIAPTLIYALYETLRAVLKSRNLATVLTRLVKGMLLIPWQIKGHCELLQFSAEKACFFRKLTAEEAKELSSLKQETFVLEFFEDYYAGVVQLLLQLHFLVGAYTAETSKFVIYKQILASSMAILSLIKAIQRKDDGIATKFLSYLGWISYTASRFFSFALLTSIIGGFVAVPILIHCVATSIVVFNIIKKVHAQQRKTALEGNGSSTEGRKEPQRIRKNNGVLCVLSFFLFGVPSLMYWPMMFEFKKRVYVFTFLLVGALENFLFFIIWFICKDPKLNHEVGERFATAVIILTLIACFALCLYIVLKPSLADGVALSHIRETHANTYGIFFDFCHAVQILPDTAHIDRRRSQFRRLEKSESL